MDYIPDYILLKIFKKLDKNSIKTASEVCERWRILISSCSVLMNRLDTTFNMKTPEKLAESIKKLNMLPYRSIVIRPKFYQDQKLLQKSLTVFKKNRNHIEKVEFFLASSKTIMRTMNALKSDQITSLTISQSYKEHIDESSFLNLPNLKSLETHQASGLLKMIKIHKIENLKIIHDYDDFDSADERINIFLQTCPELKTLLFEHHFPVIDVDSMNFKLTHLTVSNVEERQKMFSRRQFDTLKKLVEKSFETLELFLLGNFAGVDGILEFMLPKVKKLKYLFLVCPTFTRIEDTIGKNYTVTDLAVTLAHHCDSNVGKTRKIIRCCKAVEKLGLNSIPHDVSPLIHEAAFSMPKLKDLSIFTTKGRCYKNIKKFENLESLYVERISQQTDIKPLVNLVLASPKLKTLKVDLWGGERIAILSKDRVKKMLTTCTDLREIFIGGLFKMPNSFVEGLIEAKSSLKKLTIETYDIDMIRENAKKLLDTTIQCTAIQWKPKPRMCEEMRCSDDDDYDFYDEGPDNGSNMFNELNGVYMFFDDNLGDIESTDDEEEGLNFGNNRNFGVMRQNDSDHEDVDDRFDEMGRRRSKRLRLMR